MKSTEKKQARKPSKKSSKKPTKKLAKKSTKEPTKKPTKKPKKKPTEKSTKKPSARKPSTKAPAKKISKRPPKKTVQKSVTRRPADRRQDLAHKKVLDYVKRLGKRKAAARLETSVAQLDGWLKKKFPTGKLTAAIGLGKPGGAFTTIRNSDLSKWLKKVGHRKAAKLTGIPASELSALAKARAKVGMRSGIRFERSALEKLIRQKGLAEVAELTGAKDGDVLAARRVEKTDVTKRLQRFIDAYGQDQTASFFGVSKDTLKRWTKTNVPPSWERQINNIVGTSPDRGETEDKILEPVERDYVKNLAKAQRVVREWNKKVGKRFQISKKTIERWVRTDTFDNNFALAKKVYEDSSKPVKGKKQPPPVKPPPPPSPTLFPEEEPPSPVPTPPTGPGAGPPQPPGIDLTEIEAERLQRFKEARAEAFFHGLPESVQPLNTWSRISQWVLTNRYGVRVYVKIQQFVHLLNLTSVGNKIISWARKVWKAISGDGQYMTIRLTFSAMGAGNPFYAEAWVPDDKRFDFFTRNTDQITDVREVDYQVRSLLQDAYEVSKEVLLFFEHFEIVKSLPKEKTPSEKAEES